MDNEDDVHMLFDELTLHVNELIDMVRDFGEKRGKVDFI
jgi:hypothetical protein